MALTEADTCRKFVVPKLQAAGWDDLPHAINEQRTFTDGRIVFVGGKARRGRQKRADYILRYSPDFPLAVVEAKSRYNHPAEGLQQAKEYAEILGLKFAYATNGAEIVEFDYTTGVERQITDFPTPAELWRRLRAAEGISDDDVAEKLLTPTYPDRAKPLRYYQEIAVNRAVQAVLQGRHRVLLTLCTGAGKTAVAFQIAWKLWSARWSAKGSNRKPKILFLADRNVLVDDPMAKDFSPFGDARQKIAGGVAVKSRDMYFAIYQSIARDENRPGLYREYPRDFFDLIIVDECHRGSARDDSNWREILEWFEPATQIGMTATPRREDNVDTYNYFGDPIYEYSLAQGIADGFLAPYRVHRIITDYDAAGWRPTKGELDRYGREIPDSEYGTRDFERVVALRARTQAIARHLADFMRETDRFAKTIVFCVDQEHALEMRHVLATVNADLVKDYPDYVCRVTADEGDIGSAHRAKFQDVETKTPVILTTSQLLTTGVDAPTCKNVVLARIVGSMPEFKQIIGRGTRLRPDYGKLAFNIIDYTGTATEKFADPAFDGEPVREQEEVIDAEGAVIEEHETEEPIPDPVDMPDLPDYPVDIDDEPDTGPRKFYVDGGEVEIIRHMVYELDADGKQLACRQLTDYTGDKVRTLYPNASELRADWLDPQRRAEIVERLEDKGIDLETLGVAVGKPEADPFDLLCHLAYNAPLRTRRERADRVKWDQFAFFERFGPQAREVLDALLEKYAEHGSAQFKLPDILEVPPFNEWGNVVEIASRFGGSKELRGAVTELQRLLYTA
ncbi:EcoAI/FtnUII family type I restriction enzme subunit R [Pannonibacter indicus]|uniref:Type I site-specific restriction endonuclease, part of a restriction-modification system n=1 Tax=Pannonibacter indicus TaxID=466044 RepID=A0A0K6ID20_9HYPH|nr:DEAD/DEAH box helicase family protein [Pannonibacter indicus]CUB00948.1 Type I site-specific restriction endonuclease, part of a restriction-modification system [Pannonibacter indicus]